MFPDVLVLRPTCHPLSCLGYLNLRGARDLIPLSKDICTYCIIPTQLHSCFLLPAFEASTPLFLDSRNRSKQALLKPERIAHAVATRTRADQFSSSWQRTWTLFSVESSTSSSMPAFRCGPMPASQLGFLYSCPAFFGLDGRSCSRSSLLFDDLREQTLDPVRVIFLECQPHRPGQYARRASISCDDP
jgi:hypothetical protein